MTCALALSLLGAACADDDDGDESSGGNGGDGGGGDMVVTMAGPEVEGEADALLESFAAFEEERRDGSVLNPATGIRFRDEILAVGGSRPALESFKAFRGRPPSVDALLRHSGMILA